MSTISASTTSTTAYKVTADTTGTLVFQTGATPTTAMTLGSDQSVTFAGTPTYSGGTANGVAYLNGSKVLTTGSALVFDGTNLGIGTSSPASPLQINSATAPTSGSILRIDNTATTTYSAGGYVGGQIRINFTNATSRYAGINFSNTGATSQEFFGAVQNASGYNDFVWQGFNGSYGERMRLDSSGNLGLGVTPSAWFTSNNLKAVQLGGGSVVSYLNNQVWLASNYYLNSSGQDTYVGTGASNRLILDGAYKFFTAPSGTAGNAITFTQAMTLNASGNQLLGTTTDYGGRLTVVPASTPTTIAGGNQIQVGESSSNTGYRLQIGYVNDASVGFLGSIQSYGAGSPNNLVLQGAGGNLLVGTTASGAKFRVYGNAESNGRRSELYIGWSGAGGVPENYYDADRHIFRSGSGVSEYGRFDSSGNLQVGPYTPPNLGYVTATTASGQPGLRVVGSSAVGDGNIIAMVDKYSSTNTTNQWFLGFTISNQTTASGVITANGASQAAFGSWSDRRLKENIVDLPPQLANIMALRPVEFDYIASEGGGHQISFIAQEFEEIYPDAIGERPDGMKTLTGWSKTEARLVKAIQEMKAIIDTQASTITQLQADVAAIKGASA